MDMREMMERARAMQEKAAELQRAMAAVEVEGQSGGGLVRAVITGSGVLKRMSIDPTLLKPEEGEILEDLVVAAHADAKTKLDARLAQEMSHLAGQLGLPPGL
jgi:DNA-binding YbaB/EbfC family protein